MAWLLLRRLKIFKRCLGKAKPVKRMKLAKAHLTRFKPVSSTYIEPGGGYDTSLNIRIAAGQVAGLQLGVVIKPGQSSIRQAV